MAVVAIEAGSFQGDMTAEELAASKGMFRWYPLESAGLLGIERDESEKLMMFL